MRASRIDDPFVGYDSQQTGHALNFRYIFSAKNHAQSKYISLIINIGHVLYVCIYIQIYLTRICIFVTTTYSLYYPETTAELRWGEV